MHYFKYIIKGFKANLSRFLAVIAIVALGVGVLVGLLSSPSDLEESLNNYYDNNNLMDLVIKSSIGFSSNTKDIINDDNLIIEYLYINDDNLYYNDEKYKAREISRTMNSNINNLTLIEGNFPSNKNECVALKCNSSYLDIKIGDTFEFGSNEYKVSGIVSSAEFYSLEKEYDLTGGSKLDFIFYIDSSLNNTDTITDLYIRFKSLEYINRFSKKYLTYEKILENNIKDLEDEILESRKNELEISIKASVTEEIRKEVEKNVPEDMVDSIISSDTVKNKIEELTSNELDNIISTNGYELYFLNLNSNMSFKSFKENANKVNKIVVVFPVFFFFIAALVSLTTLTRLVEEERGGIGLLKSLGYSKAKISIKYILYGFVCSIIGAVLGLLLGIFIIPYVIQVAFNSLYVMPEPSFIFNILVNLFAFLLMVLTIFIVSLYVTLKVLKERPCQLLLPKAPRAGKRILLEKIPFIWKKIKFKHKNMLRNIFRYKKNLIMMVIGVGGCVALLLCAFGISDVISNVGNSEYKDVLNYNLKVSLASNTEIDNDKIDEITYANIDNVYLDNDTLEEYEISKVIVSDDISKFIIFKYNNDELDIKDNDIIISKQLSEHFNLKIGSSFIIDGNEYIVSKIMNNPIGNYVYIIDNSNSYDINYCYINTNNENSLINDLSSLDNVKSIEARSSLSTSYDMMSSSLTLVVLVIILCSGALAIIVIYNLTNININERFKELATLKVLGYQKNEVCGYIYREVFIMSMLGVILGFIVGPLFFSFIIYNLQSPGLTFSNIINPIYFLYAFLLTILFVILVDLLFIPKINKIKMVESLKCVE